MSSDELLDVIADLKNKIYDANNESNYLETEMQLLSKQAVMERFGIKAETTERPYYINQNHTLVVKNSTEKGIPLLAPSVTTLFPNLLKL